MRKLVFIFFVCNILFVTKQTQAAYCHNSPWVLAVSSQNQSNKNIAASAPAPNSNETNTVDFGDGSVKQEVTNIAYSYVGNKKVKYEPFCLRLFSLPHYLDLPPPMK